jgi:integrase
MSVPALRLDVRGADHAAAGASGGDLGDLPETAQFTRMLAALSGTEDYHRQLLARRAIFLERWPTLAAWRALPLATRVGTHKGPTAGGGGSDARLSYANRHYLVFLALTGRATFDYPWILSAGAFRGLWQIADALGLQLRGDVAALLAGARDTGWSASTCRVGLPWTVARVVLHHGDPRCASITAAQLAGLEAAALAAPARDGRSLRWVSHRCAYPRLTHAVLFQAGLIAEEVRPIHAKTNVRLVGSAAIRIPCERYLNVVGTRVSRGAASSIAHALRLFTTWLAAARPQLNSLTELDRPAAEEFLAWLLDHPAPSTGRPYAPGSRRGIIVALAQFFRDTALWGWDDVPGVALIIAGDVPKLPLRLPRFIPDAELARLMDAIAELDCDRARAALIVARWSGARRDEIRRLDVDCLSAYDDGYPRLRIPAGKTLTERSIPLHPDAAAALQVLIDRRRSEADTPLVDRITGRPTRYIFASQGKLRSPELLFQDPLREACRRAGLVDATGRAEVTAHRFRHTVGTQLAERGARLQTIMSVLGHVSPAMSMIYARVSDPTVRRDYELALASGVLAGPAADAIRSGALDDATVDWLKTNFYKTALEYGHCLRLPAEGPCECDLALTCAKFLTTTSHAPALQRRWDTEQTLIADAQARGWDREVHRHQSVANRIQDLLAELDAARSDSACAADIDC